MPHLRVYGDFLPGQLRDHRRRPGSPGTACRIKLPDHGHHRRHCFYLIGVGLVYDDGHANLADLEARIGGVTDINLILMAAGFITVRLALKAAVFPCTWLLNAYAHAPHMVTVFWPHSPQRWPSIN